MTHFEPEVTSRIVASWDRSRMDANFTAIQRRLRQQRRIAPRTWALAAIAACVAMIGIGFGWWRAQTVLSVPTATYAGTSEATAATTTRFGDGSTATALTAGAVLEVRKTSDAEIVVSAKSGSYRFDVVPNPARRFIVQVADVTVRVLGTEFVVAQSARRAEVRVERGRVEVTWPSGRAELGAGESGWFPPQPGANTAAPEPSSVDDSEVAAPSVTVQVSERSRFIELSRAGNYQAAYSIVHRTPNLLEGSAEDLMMAADAARLSNHPAQAVPYLQRITKEHARDSRAPLAAFTLGRIYMNQLAQPAAAASAFALVRQLAPSGALVEDALAREAEAREQAGQHAAAERLVQEYLRQYPSGRRSEKLRQLGKATERE